MSYRTPEEEQAQREHDAHVLAVLDQAVTDGASLMAAIRLGEPQDVMELWTDRLWNGLRDNLSDNNPADVIGGRTISREDRLTAIVLLLTNRINDAADLIVDSIPEVAE